MERSSVLGGFAVCTELVPKAAEASWKAAGAVNGSWLSPWDLLVCAGSLPGWVLVDTRCSVRNPTGVEFPLKLGVLCLGKVMGASKLFPVGGNGS